MTGDIARVWSKTVLDTAHVSMETDASNPDEGRVGSFRRTLLSCAAALLTCWASLLLFSSSTLAQDATLRTTGGIDGADVRAVLGLGGANNVGAGLSFKLGVLVELDGATSTLDQLSVSGASLAAAQIEAAGGPSIQLLIRRVQSGDASSTARALSELAGEGTSVVLTDSADSLPGLVEGLEQNKMLGLDGTTGISDSNQGRSFFWGTRAAQPDDDFAGALQYLIEAEPATKTVALVYRDEGQGDATLVGNFTEALQLDGLKLGDVEVSKSGATDYSGMLGRLAVSNPDAIFVFETGTDLGHFMGQFSAAGLKARIIGTDYSAAAAQIAGAGFDNYLLATDWFDAGHPSNNWADLFVRSYKVAYGALPEVNAANAYEDTFAVWTLIRRLLAKGKSPGGGQALQDELIANRGFKTLYGGDGSELDDMLLDTKSHRVIERPFGVYRVNGGALRPVARFDIGGANFELVDGK